MRGNPDPLHVLYIVIAIALCGAVTFIGREVMLLLCQFLVAAV